MNVKNDLHTFVYSVQIVFNVHNHVKLKILTIYPYISTNSLHVDLQ